MAIMPTDKNIPPLDSFEHEHKVTERRVDMKDSILSGDTFNPAKGADRIATEQYDTTTFNPGRPNTETKGVGQLQAGIHSEQFATVKSKLA
jgi:hypothetical protein